MPAKTVCNIRSLLLTGVRLPGNLELGDGEERADNVL